MHTVVRARLTRTTFVQVSFAKKLCQERGLTDIPEEHAKSKSTLSAFISGPYARLHLRPAGDLLRRVSCGPRPRRHV
jgi:hypothetical protein